VASVAEKPTVPVSEVRDLLAAIRDMLDLPSTPPEFDEARTWLLRVRVSMVVGSINHVVDERGDVDALAGALRRLLEDHPVTYPVAGDAPGDDEQAGGDR
jgi:hypothetical protein